jgi:hypothetical protein
MTLPAPNEQDAHDYELARMPTTVRLIRDVGPSNRVRVLMSSLLHGERTTRHQPVHRRFLQRRAPAFDFGLSVARCLRGETDSETTYLPVRNNLTTTCRQCVHRHRLFPSMPGQHERSAGKAQMKNHKPAPRTIRFD